MKSFVSWYLALQFRQFSTDFLLHKLVSSFAFGLAGVQYSNTKLTNQFLLYKSTCLATKKQTNKT